MAPTGKELRAPLMSSMATIMFVWAIIQQYFPHQFRCYIERYVRKLTTFLYPYITITFPEYAGERLRRSEAFAAIQNYLSSRSLTGAKRLKAESVKDTKSLVLSMDDYEQVTDQYKGVEIWWTFGKIISKKSNEKRFYELTFHRRHREIILGSFVNHMLEEGKAVQLKNRQRKLYMNNSSNDWWHKSWSHVPFDHPSSFRTLAMDPTKKKGIVDDLLKFKNGKEYYEKVGKAWKRGFLLYGPPGTGKSSMIAAMANFMEYDVYDLELTSVKDNAALKKLLIEISSRSIIVIEDIDCSLDLTGQRKKKMDWKEKEKDETKTNVESKVTLSGLLNFIDGIWSASGGERLIVFTTNHKEKLDEALIRRGRMDKHIEMSYCGFEAFKILAMNYLDVEWHDSYEKIRRLLEEIEMTPADVTENLMPKSEVEEVDECFRRLIESLEREAKKKKAKEAAKIIEKEKEEKKEDFSKNGEE